MPSFRFATPLALASCLVFTTASAAHADDGCAILPAPGGIASALVPSAWPGGVVPYEFDANVTPVFQAAALDAMAKLSAVTAVRFVARTTESNYVHVLDWPTNNSYVGMIGGAQVLNVHAWDSPYMIAHMLMHTLGFFHEHDRTDRDSYIAVQYDNVQAGFAGAFDIAPGAILHGTYDFDSVMHYGECTFSQCCGSEPDCPACLTDSSCRTISVLSPNEGWQQEIGQRTHLSDGDVDNLRWVYCSEWIDAGTVVTPARGYVAAAYDAARSVGVLFGGYNNAGVPGGVLADTWTFDERGWHLQQPAVAPPPRSHHALAYDSDEERVVLFGGYGNPGVKSDTWTWDGTTWTSLAIANPPARYVHCMTYDTVHHGTLLFGGYDTGPLGDTWELTSAGTWIQRSTSGPAPREQSAMAFDPERGVAVLFGGESAQGLQSDTWEWDGNAGTWMQRSGAGPSPRRAHTMAFDSARHKVVLFGGYNGSGLGLSDSWEWDGTTWTQFFSQGSPRYTHAMFYDALANAIVVAGGYSDAYLGTTWELTSSYPSVLTQPEGQTVTAGCIVTFTVEVSGDLEPSFEWRRNGVALDDGGAVSGATTSTLTFTSVRAADAGTYDVVVRAPCGTATSAGAVLVVITPCPADMTGDSAVNGADLAMLLADWGIARSVADLNNDGTVGGADLAILLASWGSCP